MSQYFWQFEKCRDKIFHSGKISRQAFHSGKISRQDFSLWKNIATRFLIMQKYRDMIIDYGKISRHDFWYVTNIAARFWYQANIGPATCRLGTSCMLFPRELMSQELTLKAKGSRRVRPRRARATSKRFGRSPPTPSEATASQPKHPNRWCKPHLMKNLWTLLFRTLEVFLDSYMVPAVHYWPVE